MATLFAVLFLWATRGLFWTPLTAFFPQFHLVFLATLLVCVGMTLKGYGRWKSLLEKMMAWRNLIFPPFAFILPLLIALFFFNETPHPMDAAHYLWTAKLFLTGQLYLPLPPFYEHVNEGFMVMHDGRYYSIFPPGFPVLLMPFAALGLAFWLNPILNGLAVYLTGRIAEELTHDRRVATLAMLLATVSSFHLFLSATLFPHPAVLVLTLLAILVAVRGDLTVGRIALIATLCALIIPIRMQDGLFTTAAIGLFLLLRHGRPDIGRLIAFILPVVAGCAVMLCYQKALTGEWLTLPQDLYFSITEEDPSCHHIGLGTGCRYLNGSFLPPEGLTLQYAFFVTMTRLSMLLYKFTVHPLMFLFVISAVWLFPRRHAAALLLSAAFIGGYLFFYQDGNFYGPRYYYSLGMPLLIAAADGFVLLRDRLGRVGRQALLALPLAGALFTGAVIIPQIAVQQASAWYAALDKVKLLVAQRAIHEAVIFIPYRFNIGYSFANTLSLQERPPFDRAGNRYLNSMPVLDAQTAAWFLANGYRSAWRVTESADDLFSIAPLQPAPPDHVSIEAEYKFKPLTGSARYGFMVGNLRDEPGFGFRAGVTPLSGYFAYALRFGPAGAGQYWDTEQYFVSAGRYRLSVEAIATPCGGEFAFSVNGRRLGTFPAGSDQQKAVQFVAEACLPAGANRFVLTPLDDEQCLVIDRIVADRIDDCR
ncbi:MAG TPA: hypothetical protein PLV42_01370 [bacterium]|nr:hypothetical protein [bacterium]